MIFKNFVHLQGQYLPRMPAAGGRFYEEPAAGWGCFSQYARMQAKNASP